MTITLSTPKTIEVAPAQPAQTKEITEFELDGIFDNMKDCVKASIRVDGLARTITLWDGEEEYTAAGQWTDEDAIERLKDLL